MFMLMGVAFAIWVLPETFGKSLEEMVCGSDYDAVPRSSEFAGSGLWFGRGPGGYGSDGAHIGISEKWGRETVAFR